MDSGADGWEGLYMKASEERDALRDALKRLLDEASAIHGDDLADSRTAEMARAALRKAGR